MSRLLRLLLLVSVAPWLLSACNKSSPSGQRGQTQKPVPVVIDSVREQAWSDQLRALGTVRAHEAVTLTAKVSETVQQVHFESGQEVAKGAPLLTLSGRQQQAALDSAQAQLQEAEQAFQRQSQLAAQQLVAKASLDSARASRDAARAQVAQIRANLADRVIRAPFAGVLGIRQLSPGALVTPGTLIATLDDLSRVYVDFPVPETELADVTEGQSLRGNAGAWPGHVFNGKVAVVSPRLEAATRSAIVRGDFANPERLLKPGMLVEVALARSSRPALVVPELAVQQIGTETFVWRVKSDNTVEKADVVVGGRIPGKVMLQAGIQAGERIVTEGVGKLRLGSKVVAAKAGADGAAAAVVK